jgi:hypothetical protein
VPLSRVEVSARSPRSTWWPQIRYALRPCQTPIPRSSAHHTSKLIERVTTPGGAVALAWTTPTIKTAAKRERGSGACSRGKRNALRWCIVPEPLRRVRPAQRHRNATNSAVESPWQGAFFSPEPTFSQRGLSERNAGRALSDHSPKMDPRGRAQSTSPGAACAPYGQVLGAWGMLADNPATGKDRSVLKGPQD